MAPSATAIRIDSVPQVTCPSPRPVQPPHSTVDRGPAPDNRFLQEVLLDNHRFKSSSKTLDLVVAVFLHIVILGGPIFAGLYYTDTINMKEFSRTLLVAPPPAPPPPPPPSGPVIKVQAAKRVFVNHGKLIAPSYVPKQVAQIKEAPLESDVFAGATGGVLGGVPGGQLGGVMGGIIGGVPSIAAKPPANEGRSRPVRVGGMVREPKAISKVNPQYPALARQAHVGGDVVVDTILDERGNVTDMKVVSGPALLYGAALSALSQWKYEPTYLNDQPVAVEMVVTISFHLSSQ